MQRQSLAAYSLLGMFLALYFLSMFLPGLVTHTYLQGRDHETAATAVAFLEQDQSCWTADGPVHLTTDHMLANARGVKLPNPPPESLACHDPKKDHVAPGWWILLIGWGGAFAGTFAWYANVLAWVGVFFAIRGHKPERAAGWALGGVVLGLDGFRLTEIPPLGGPGDIFDHFAAGYYVWELSMVMLLLSQIVTIRERRARNSQEPVT